MRRTSQSRFAGHDVEQLSDGQRAEVWYRGPLACALSAFAGGMNAAEALIEQSEATGAVEFGPFDKPGGVFTIINGIRIDQYPPGRYMVREQRDGTAVLWRLDE